jgi:hypothetical protein
MGSESRKYSPGAQVRGETLPPLVQFQEPPPASQFAPSPEISNDSYAYTAAALHVILVDNRIRIAEDVAANLVEALSCLPPDRSL